MRRHTENWKDMAELALMYNCPLVVSAPNDLNTLVSLLRLCWLTALKILVLDPGTFLNEGLGPTINNFTMLRRAACKGGEELAGFPLMGVPMVMLGSAKATQQMKSSNGKKLTCIYAGCEIC